MNMIISTLLVYILSINSIYQYKDTIDYLSYAGHINDSPLEFRKFSESMGFTYVQSECIELILCEDIFKPKYLKDSSLKLTKGFFYLTIIKEKGWGYEHHRMYGTVRRYGTSKLPLELKERIVQDSIKNYNYDIWEKISLTGIPSDSFPSLLHQLEKNGYREVNHVRYRFGDYDCSILYTKDDKHYIAISNDEMEKSMQFSLFFIRNNR